MITAPFLPLSFVNLCLYERKDLCKYVRIDVRTLGLFDDVELVLRVHIVYRKIAESV